MNNIDKIRSFRKNVQTHERTYWQKFPAFVKK